MRRNAGAAGEVAAVAAGPVVGAQQLVEQVAVAVLHVDEVEAGLVGEHGGVDVAARPARRARRR